MSGLSGLQSGFLLAGASCMLLSLIFYLKELKNISLIFLILTSFFIFSFSALLDPFLNLWDERFHALVAKNLMKHPLIPTLYDNPIVNIAYDRWDRYHIWLHKQPLFLWQIALSFKLFGFNEYALRLPDIILGSFLVIAFFRTATILVNERTGVIACLIFISNMFINELISGRQELEHNDFTFLAYISLSIWSFIEFKNSGNKYWIYLIGIFSGFAILCKWLVGLLVYLGWSVYELTDISHKEYSGFIKNILISFMLCVIIALPWQLLCFRWYPSESGLAYKYFLFHFSKVLDGHSGSAWYHFNEFKEIYGILAVLLIIPAFVILYKRIKDKRMYFSFLVMLIAVYLFFTLTVTKMPAFTTVVALIIIISLAAFADYIITLIQKNINGKSLQNVVFLSSVLIIIVLNFRFQTLLNKHVNGREDWGYSEGMKYNTRIFKSLKLPENTVLFNVKGRHYIEAMFYTGLPCYNFVPDKMQYNDMKIKNKILAIFKPDNTKLPEYLLNDNSIIIINKELKVDE